MGIRNEYECAFAEEQVRHDKQMVVVVKENAGLSEMKRKDNATIFEMRRYLDKYTTYNSHETHTIKNLSSQIGALERENKRLKGDKSGYQLRKRPATSRKFSKPHPPPRSTSQLTIFTKVTQKTFLFTRSPAPRQSAPVSNATSTAGPAKTARFRKRKTATSASCVSNIRSIPART